MWKFFLEGSDCEELVGFIHKRCGFRFWKVVKRNKFLEAIYSMGVRYSITPRWLRFHNQIIKVNFPYVIDLKHHGIS